MMSRLTWIPSGVIPYAILAVVIALLGRSLGLRPFYWVGRYARCLLARRLLCRLLEQLQKPLSASPRQLSRGQPSSWDIGAGLDKRFCVRVLGERLGGHTHLCADVVGLFLGLHILFLL